MRRSLLLSKAGLIGSILTIGQCTMSRMNESKPDNREPVTGDTLSNVYPGRVADTTIIDSLDDYEVRIDSTKPRRIEHGSDNAARLDSIKKAKSKKKN